MPTDTVPQGDNEPGFRRIHTTPEEYAALLRGARSPIDDVTALNLIAQHMSESEDWDADLWDIVNDIVIRTGRRTTDEPGVDTYNRYYECEECGQLIDTDRDPTPQHSVNCTVIRRDT